MHTSAQRRGAIACGAHVSGKENLSLGNAFSQDMLDAMPNPQTKLACLRVLLKWAGVQLYLPQAEKKSARRHRVAADMIRQGMAPREIASILRSRFQISWKTARRDVEKTQGKMSTNRDQLARETADSKLIEG